MKKSLYGTTALVAAGVLAASPAFAENEPVSLGLGGYYNSYFGFGDVDNSSGRDWGSTGVYADGEVHFKGSTTLDNGITFGVQIELEAFQSGDQIDENYAFISGSFGRVVIGGENTAGYMMQYAAPNVGAPINSGWQTVFTPPALDQTTGFRTPGLSTYVDLANDDHAITYYSPRFSGFQIAGSYVPAATVNGEGKNSPVYADRNTEMHDLFSVGANFVESFNGFDVAIAGGYRIAQAPDGSGLEDPNQISAGINLGYAGFTVGGSWAREDSDRTTDGNAFDAGVSYSTGPWSVGVNAIKTDVEGDTNPLTSANTRNDEMFTVKGAVAYSVGPGITASGSVMYTEWDGASEDVEGIVGIVGMKISY